ncbi:hypothetical protein ATE92_1538 [Ulvibacter sp. MAR_2010_11]|uniref:hypothetical protein n=1 Tax=Ulvibacter sp. MAR_2010_11 TaxID=1250229 RepID=UPI000CBD7135|nr:hypothetical protein [Ulvibacter sp. MAR_2010_11]PKA83386.1 hypothetical protein ATE92_1538 [Ulvibacter sp. MAR_2010_11]
MKSTYAPKLSIFICGFLIFYSGIVFSQVGINTTTPNGILDINSSTTGFVLPRVSLTSTIIQAPVINPQTGSIPIGTAVYNTNTTSTGTNDVSPGMYVWDGAKWAIEFTRKQAALYESNLGMRTVSSGSFANVSGLVNQNFTAQYTGYYKVLVNVNFGGGGAKVPKKSGTGQSQGYLNIARQSGTFRLNFGGTNYDIPAHSYSTAYEPAVSATNYFAIWEEFSTIFYVYLNANQSRSFTLSFDQDPAPEFISNGDSGTGRGYISYDIPCTVEIIYVGD